MRTLISRIILGKIVVLFLILFFCSPVSAECEKARMLYERALAQDITNEERIYLLKLSADECSGFPVYFALGKAYAAKKDFDGSLVFFKKAAAYAGSDEEKGIIYQTIGIVSQASGHADEALMSYRQALRFMRSNEIEEAMMQLEQGEAESVVSAEMILSRFTKTRSLSVVGVKQSITLRIHFNSNTAKLSQKGKQQAEELGKVLTSADLLGMKFRLIGHTDLKGDTEYNRKLSLKRADAVRNYLVSRFHIESRRISIEGKGEEEPLYILESDETNALNRRVEVIVEDQ